MPSRFSESSAAAAIFAGESPGRFDHLATLVAMTTSIALAALAKPAPDDRLGFAAAVAGHPAGVGVGRVDALEAFARRMRRAPRTRRPRRRSSRRRCRRARAARSRCPCFRSCACPSAFSVSNPHHVEPLQDFKRRRRRKARACCTGFRTQICSRMRATCARRIRSAHQAASHRRSAWPSTTRRDDRCARACRATAHG